MRSGKARRAGSFTATRRAMVISLATRAIGETFTFSASSRSAQSRPPLEHPAHQAAVSPMASLLTVIRCRPRRAEERRIRRDTQPAREVGRRLCRLGEARAASRTLSHARCRTPFRRYRSQTPPPRRAPIAPRPCANSKLSSGRPMPRADAHDVASPSSCATVGLLSSLRRGLHSWSNVAMVSLYEYVLRLRARL